MQKNPVITRTIWLLSLVSLFTDFASEMLYPVMPVYLRHIGFSVLLIGILEGVAESVAGLSKSYFGRLSDRTGKRLPFVQWGYALSAISKPMMALLVNAWWIFSARTLDRLGKGIRTGARDAMLSEETTARHKGTVFGFHRSMDTWGAVLGPLAALIFLYFYPGAYKTIFLLAFLPGLLAIALTLMIKEKSREEAPRKNISLMEGFRYWSHAPPSYRKLIFALLLFALFNSSDLFLLLKIKEAGFEDTVVIAAYIFYNLVYALLAYPVGKLGDRIGLLNTLLLGMLFFAGAYAGFAFSNNLFLFIAFFLLYGIYAAATEGIAKALITNIVLTGDTATAIGTYTGFQSIASLLSSSLAGLIWTSAGPGWVFLTAATASALVVAYLWIQRRWISKHE